MKSRWIPIVCALIFLSACGGPMSRGGHGGGGPALILGLGVAAGVAIAALSAPRYAPGHSMHTLPRGAIAIHHGGIEYRYHTGIYYRHMGDDYRVVLPPPGLIIHSRLPHPDTIFIDDETYYVVEGVYYQRSGNNYMVVKAPINSAQTNSEGYKAGQHYAVLPDGAKPVKIDNTQYFAYSGLFFLPQSSDGQVTYLAVKLN
ncbi:DUF6515 family protein [Neptunomonas antarctica]|uniref:Uncharacterized protein n=1 Tax=Neptunomonas antarctica TaxID=619304 RepID=A0A1N7NLV2_9GAMM|nr:DUF6515 family protein [Neptunomonas antarctica]SIS99208.1 hypothetical protein SAMN05421760_11033 [Neptunomonas antarctica]